MNTTDTMPTTHRLDVDGLVAAAGYRLAAQVLEAYVGEQVTVHDVNDSGFGPMTGVLVRVNYWAPEGRGDFDRTGLTFNVHGENGDFIAACAWSEYAGYPEEGPMLAGLEVEVAF